MAWLAVDRDEMEYIYSDEPRRSTDFWLVGAEEAYIPLPKGSIQKLLGRKLTWNDDAVEIDD